MYFIAVGHSCLQYDKNDYQNNQLVCYQKYWYKIHQKEVDENLDLKEIWTIDYYYLEFKQLKGRNWQQFI